MHRLLALALLSVAAPSAFAEEPAPAPATAPATVPEKPSEPDRSHRLQFGVAVTAGSGYRVLFKYAGAQSCDGVDPSRNTCYGRVPTWLDVKLFFGVHRAVDVVLEQRFGLETDFTGSHPLLFMPGVRLYPDGQKAFKFYVQLQLVIDYTDPGIVYHDRIDLGFHEANGFQWDFARYGGIYFQISETFGFLRSFDFQLEAGAGIEGRFP